MATPLPDQQPTSGEPAAHHTPGHTPGTAAATPADAVALDPVRQRREVFRRWVSLANRLGYLLLLAAIAVFVYAFITDFTSTMASVVIGLFIASCVLLAPSIVLGYAVKAADREDREQGF